LDPQRTKQSVDNIVDGLVEISPDSERICTDNAEQVKGELDGVDAEWEEIFDHADRDTVFFCYTQHFAYIGQRYGATIQPLVSNLAADGGVRPADMRRAEDIIADNEIANIGTAIFKLAVGVNQYLFGNLATVTDENVILLMGLFTIIALVVGITYKQLLSVTFDETAARVADINVRWYNRVIVMLAAMVVVGAMQIMGVILVAVLLGKFQSRRNPVKDSRSSPDEQRTE
jgi:hypothetical protein